MESHYNHGLGWPLHPFGKAGGSGRLMVAPQARLAAVDSRVAGDPAEGLVLLARQAAFCRLARSGGESQGMAQDHGG